MPLADLVADPRKSKMTGTKRTRSVHHPPAAWGRYRVRLLKCFGVARPPRPMSFRRLRDPGRTCVPALDRHAVMVICPR